MRRAQTAHSVLMIRPAAFGFNVDAAASNAMQYPAAQDPATVNEQARAEFSALADAVAAAGVGVCICDDTPQPVKPDALFPNNWISFHADGTLVLYPMQPASRRAERRRDVIDAVVLRLGLRIRRLLDLSGHEQRGEFLEGTGSLVLDHVRRTAYACRSARTSEPLVERWCALMGFEPVVFDAADETGRPYYHTNVMLSVGSSSVVVAAEAIAARDRQAVLRSLELSGRELVPVDRAAVRHFACNVLELAGRDAAGAATRVLVMSEAARAALDGSQLQRLAAGVDALIAVPVPGIEHVGGGSVRCMLAEVFAET